MTLAPRSKLSVNDSQVLSALFDPEASLAAEIGIQQSQDIGLKSFDCPKVEADLLSKERSALHLLSIQEPSLKTIEQALTQLGHVCKQAPTYASAWCNRAQATRLYLQQSYRHGDQVNGQDCLQAGQQNPELFRRIFEDLDTAISLALPSETKVLAAAHSHRGFLLWQCSRASCNFDAKDLPQPFTGMNRSELEERASRDFALGGKYGNTMSQKMSVLTNPYAKLCGNIVKEALKKEMEDQFVASINV